jgi:hypothetical protein
MATAAAMAAAMATAAGIEPLSIRLSNFEVKQGLAVSQALFFPQRREI